MRNFKSVWVIIMSASVLPALAYAGTTFSLVGAADWASAKTSPEVGYSYSSKLGLGGGALLGLPFLPYTQIETGALYLTRVANLSMSSGSVTQTQHAIQIPLLLRIWFMRDFSLGAGGYAALGTGNVTQASASGTTTGSFSDFNMKKNEFGALFSADFRFPISFTSAFIIDGRYSIGSNNVYSGGGSVKNRDVQFLAGFQFGFPRSRHF